MKHFTSEEFACKCCGKAEIQPDLVQALEQLRELVGGRPITVLSGYRCPAHNRAVGGAKESQHVKGTAADIRIAGLNNQQIYDLAMQVPLFKGGGFGAYDSGFVHVDIRKNPARWAKKQGHWVALSALLKV